MITRTELDELLTQFSDAVRAADGIAPFDSAESDALLADADAIRQQILDSITPS